MYGFAFIDKDVTVTTLDAASMGAFIYASDAETSAEFAASVKITAGYAPEENYQDEDGKVTAYFLYLWAATENAGSVTTLPYGSTTTDTEINVLKDVTGELATLAQMQKDGKTYQKPRYNFDKYYLWHSITLNFSVAAPADLDSQLAKASEAYAFGTVDDNVVVTINYEGSDRTVTVA